MCVCSLPCVCSLDGLNEEHEFQVWVTVFGHMSRHIHFFFSIKSCFWLPAAALIKMSPRSAFEGIWLYRATALILSAAGISLYQYTVQHHTFTSVRRYCEE